VGVYYPEDRRQGWLPSTTIRTVSLVVPQLPITYKEEVQSAKPIDVFIAEALRAELAAAGMNVISTPEFDRPAEIGTRSDAGAERVVFGRINYFAYVQPGYIGDAVWQRVMPTGKAFIDIDLWIAEPRTAEIIWAGTARGMRDSGRQYPMPPDDIPKFLGEALSEALTAIAKDSGFYAALGREALCPQTSLHEKNARLLYAGGNWAEAAAEFEKAYRVSLDASFLHNMALCYQKLGDARRSLRLFQSYLDKVPNAPRRVAVEASIRELEESLAGTEGAAAAPPAPLPSRTPP
jgi:tetratricopeptide (TPR) repeat protein